MFYKLPLGRMDSWLGRNRRFLKMSDRFSDTLTIDFMLTTSKRFKKEQNLEGTGQKLSERYKFLQSRGGTQNTTAQVSRGQSGLSENQIEDDLLPGDADTLVRQAGPGSQNMSDSMQGDDPFAHFSYEQFEKVPVKQNENPRRLDEKDMKRLREK